MHDAGADAAQIAVALDLEPESVGPLLELASAKADRIARGGEISADASRPSADGA